MPSTTFAATTRREPESLNFAAFESSAATTCAILSRSASTKSPFGGAYQNFGNPFESGGFGRSPYGKSRFDDAQPHFASSYDTPGWQRAKSHEEQRQSNWSRDADRKRQAGLKPMKPAITIEGELIASSSAKGAGYNVGARVRHQKFGPGTVAEVDGNKLTIEFDHAGRKRVVDSFVAPF